MDKENLKKIIELRHELHAHPELSLRETGTKRRLMDFIGENTTLEIVDRGQWFYAFHVVEGTEAVAFRADMDALPIAESQDLPWSSCAEGVSHKCGHDGHSAVLCGLALELERAKCPRSVYLIFQHGEEIGRGGEECASLLEERGISEVYAFHNLSGWPENAVIVRRGLCQCASRGLTVRMTGRRSHASEPEKGRNPAFALADLISHVENLLKEPHEGMVLCTVVNVRIGEKDFGISAGEGEVSVTLRADREAELRDFEEKFRERARALARDSGLEAEFEVSDPFPETVSDPGCVGRVTEAAKKLGLNVIDMPEPWRASEDFGWYTKRRPGAIFYVGNGEDYPAVHTPGYDFNDRVLETAVDVFFELSR
ncbi:MAG: amidohydrolase [Synergistaceae bacterium]|nr:amidohydrolase [Synergistaceae bacterium]